jgi:hypothetical protein
MIPCQRCACALFVSAPTPAGVFLACFFCGALKERDALPIAWAPSSARPEPALDLFERTKVIGRDRRGRVVALDSFRESRPSRLCSSPVTFQVALSDAKS